MVRPRTLNLAIVKYLYVRKKRSIKSIAKDFQVGRQAVQYALDQMNIKRRITINHPKKDLK